MSTSTARKHDPNIEQRDPRPGAPKRPPLTLASKDGVTVEGFTSALEAAAEENGQDAGVVMGVLIGALLTTLPAAEQANLWGDAAEPGSPQEVEDMIRIGSALEQNLAKFLAVLREMRQVEVTASEVRTNWSDYLERVRAKDQTVYITLHGKRVAALTPAYVAEQYASDQEMFWTPEWQAGDAEIDAEKAAGRTTRAATEDEFFAALGGRGE